MGRCDYEIGVRVARSGKKLVKVRQKGKQNHNQCTGKHDKPKILSDIVMRCICGAKFVGVHACGFPHAIGGEDKCQPKEKYEIERKKDLYCDYPCWTCSSPSEKRRAT